MKLDWRWWVAMWFALLWYAIGVWFYWYWKRRVIENNATLMVKVIKNIDKYWSIMIFVIHSLKSSLLSEIRWACFTCCTNSYKCLHSLFTNLFKNSSSSFFLFSTKSSFLFPNHFLAGKLRPSILLLSFSSFEYCVLNLYDSVISLPNTLKL